MCEPFVPRAAVYRANRVLYDDVIKCEVMKKDQKMPELLTLDEACALLKVHPNTLRAWDNKGILPAIRIGTKRVRRYKKEDLLRYINKPHKK